MLKNEIEIKSQQKIKKKNKLTHFQVIRRI